MIQTVARDIERCGRCPHLIFPGDEVIREGDELVHPDHLDLDAVLSYT